MHFEAIFVKEVKSMSRSYLCFFFFFFFFFFVIFFYFFFVFFFFYTVDAQCSHTINEKTVFVSCSPRPWDSLSLTS